MRGLQLKHLRWYLTSQTSLIKPATRYRRCLTIKNIVCALNKEANWMEQLQDGFKGLKKACAQVWLIGTSRLWLESPVLVNWDLCEQQASMKSISPKVLNLGVFLGACKA